MQRPGGFALEVHVQPGARRTAIVGDHGGRLKIVVNAPPLDGKANEAVLQMLSKQLGLARRAIALEAGTRGRDKRVLVSSPLTPEEAVERLVAPQK